MYKNQKEIDRVMEVMQQVSAESVFFSFLVDDNYVVQMEMCIPVKGKAEYIRKFEELGWRKIRRFKVESADFWGRQGRCQDEGHSFVQLMRRWID